MIQWVFIIDHWSMIDHFAKMVEFADFFLF